MMNYPFSDQPFLWQNKINSVVWVTFDKTANVALEKAYSQPHKNSIPFTVPNSDLRYNYI